MKSILAQKESRQTFTGRQLEFASLLKKLNENKFSGRWHVSGKPRGSQSEKITWTFFFDYGRVLFVNGGLHPVRHLRSLLQTHTNNEAYQQILKNLPDISINSNALCWEFKVLKTSLREGTLNRQQFSDIVRDTLADAIIDIWNSSNIHYDIHITEFSQLSSIVFLDPKQALKDARKEWFTWYKKGILHCQPDCGVTIKLPTVLQAETTSATYNRLKTMLNGQFSLREIAAKADKNIKTIAHSLVPLINRGVLELKDIPDLPCPVNPSLRSLVNKRGSKFTIACIDDSPLICKQMQRLVNDIGYNSVSIHNPLRAIVALLKNKPDLIFLDLVMPYTNGYEICSQLRKLHHFEDTPIVILTGNDGIVDRVRAKLAGCTDFISKPMTASTLKAVLETHLVQRVPTR